MPVDVNNALIVAILKAFPQSPSLHVISHPMTLQYLLCMMSHRWRSHRLCTWWESSKFCQNHTSYFMSECLYRIDIKAETAQKHKKGFNWQNVNSIPPNVLGSPVMMMWCTIIGSRRCLIVFVSIVEHELRAVILV